MASGVVYYGVLASQLDGAPPQHLVSAPVKLEHQRGPADAARLADTSSRIKQDLRVLAPHIVVIVGTRMHGNWVYKVAFERASLITVIMLACMELGIACEEWTTEKIGKLVDVSPSSLSDVKYPEFGFAQKPTFWNIGRGPAFAAAKAAALVSGV